MKEARRAKTFSDARKHPLANVVFVPSSRNASAADSIARHPPRVLAAARRVASSASPAAAASSVASIPSSFSNVSTRARMGTSAAGHSGSAAIAIAGRLPDASPSPKSTRRSSGPVAGSARGSVRARRARSRSARRRTDARARGNASRTALRNPEVVGSIQTRPRSESSARFPEGGAANPRRRWPATSPVPETRRAARNAASHVPSVRRRLGARRRQCRTARSAIASMCVPPTPPGPGPGPGPGTGDRPRASPPIRQRAQKSHARFHRLRLRLAAHPPLPRYRPPVRRRLPRRLVFPRGRRARWREGAPRRRRRHPRVATPRRARSLVRRWGTLPVRARAIPRASRDAGRDNRRETRPSVPRRRSRSSRRLDGPGVRKSDPAA